MVQVGGAVIALHQGSRAKELDESGAGVAASRLPQR
jgi:hypothetical protein